MKKFNVAIVGATGAVGKELIRILALRQFPVHQLTLLASARSAGKNVETEFGELTIKPFSEVHFESQDIVFFATNGTHALNYAPIAAKAGAMVIDNSSAFRLDKNIPLIVPEVNGDILKGYKGIIANPNCSTIQMVVTLNPLHQLAKIKRVVVSTYQAVSGAGVAGMDELNNQMRAKVKGEEIEPKQFTKPILANVIPHIDVFQENGYTKEEMKMVHETQKILGDPDIKISATCVRVPVKRAHSEAINVETHQFIGAKKAREIFESARGIEVIDQRQDGGYPTPIEVAETIPTYVGRIRDDISCENGIAYWCVADQLWKGAALNAVQIAEVIAQQTMSGDV